MANSVYSLDNPELFRLFLEHTPAGVAMFDCQMRYLMVSRRWLLDWGLENLEILGYSHYELFPNLPERWKALHQRCLAGESLECKEDCLIKDNGAIEWVKWEIHPWWNGEGRVGGIIIFFEVITEYKQTKEALTRALQEQESIFQAIPDLLYVVDAQGYLLKWNQQVEVLTGLSAAELKGRAAVSLSPESEHEIIAAAIQESLEFGQAELSIHLFAQDGTLVEYQFNVVPLKDSEGKLLGFTGMGRDITEYRQLECLEREKVRLETEIALAKRVEIEHSQLIASLQESEARFRATFEQAAVGIVHCDLTGKFLRINQRFCD